MEAYKYQGPDIQPIFQVLYFNEEKCFYDTSLQRIVTCMYLLPAIIEFLSYGLDYEEALLIRVSTIFKNLEHQQI